MKAPHTIVFNPTAVKPEARAEGNHVADTETDRIPSARGSGFSGERATAADPA